jgi:hypothetical protein
MADDALEALWEAARADWAADAPNRAFIEYCRARGELPEAAKRYREAKDAGAGTEAIQKRLAAIALIAMNDIDTRKSEAPSKRPHPVLVVFAAGILGVALYGLWLAFFGQ